MFNFELSCQWDAGLELILAELNSREYRWAGARDDICEFRAKGDSNLQVLNPWKMQDHLYALTSFPLKPMSALLW